MAIPKYDNPRFIKAALTDELMDDCLGACDFPTLTIGAARDACYCWMSHSAVWNEEYDKFAEELKQDPEYAGEDPLAVIQSISYVISEYLLNSKIWDYMKHELDYVAVETALKKTNVQIPADEGAFLLGLLAVGGSDSVQSFIFDSEDEESAVTASITLEDVISLADAYAA